MALRTHDQNEEKKKKNVLKKICFGIGATIRIVPEIQCVPNAGLKKKNICDNIIKTRWGRPRL